MKFALNYSPQARYLVEAGVIDIDLFKCPDWNDLVEEAQQVRPVYVHFPLKAGQRNLEQVGIERIHCFLDTTETRMVNTHLIPRLSDVENPEDRSQIVASMLADVEQMVAVFGADNVIAENIPFPEQERDKPILNIDPTVISQVIDETKVGFLLDIGHAKRTAEHLATDPKRYIASLPVHRLKELHITGLGYHHETGHRCDHMPMTPDDWDLFEWVMDHVKRGEWAKPEIVACEYGGIGPHFEWRTDADVIQTDIPRMLEIVRASEA